MMVNNGLGRDQDTLNDEELEYYQKVSSLGTKCVSNRANFGLVCLCISIGLYTDTLLCKIEHVVLPASFNPRFKLRNSQPRYRDRCDTVDFKC